MNIFEMLSQSKQTKDFYVKEIIDIIEEKEKKYRTSKEIDGQNNYQLLVVLNELKNQIRNLK